MPSQDDQLISEDVVELDRAGGLRKECSDRAVDLSIALPGLSRIRGIEKVASGLSESPPSLGQNSVLHVPDPSTVGP
jgi:hypothetical protein